MNLNEYNIYKMIIDQQNSHYTTLITVLISCFLAIIGFNWFINRKLLIHQMNNHIHDEIEKVKESLLKSIDTKFQLSELKFKQDISKVHSRVMFQMGLKLTESDKRYALELFLTSVEICIDNGETNEILAPLSFSAKTAAELALENIFEIRRLDAMKRIANKIPKYYRIFGEL